MCGDVQVTPKFERVTTPFFSLKINKINGGRKKWMVNREDVTVFWGHCDFWVPVFFNFSIFDVYFLCWPVIADTSRYLRTFSWQMVFISMQSFSATFQIVACLPCCFTKYFQRYLKWRVSWTLLPAILGVGETPVSISRIHTANI